MLRALVLTTALTLTLNLTAQDKTNPAPAAGDAAATKPAAGDAAATKPAAGNAAATKPAAADAAATKPAAGDAAAPKKHEFPPAGMRRPDDFRPQIDPMRGVGPGLFGFSMPGVNPGTLDTNHNLLVDKDEIAAAMPVVAAKIKEDEALILKAFDKNGNGAIDADERETIKRVQDALRAVEVTRRYDTNQDGTISDDEMTALQKSYEEQAERINKMTLQRLDTNNDGVIDDAEQKAFREHGARERPRDPRGPGATRKPGLPPPTPVPAPAPAPAAPAPAPVEQAPAVK